MQRHLLVLTSLILLPAALRCEELAIALKADVPSVAFVTTPIPVRLTAENTGTENITLLDFPRPRVVRLEVLDAADRKLIHRGFASPGGPPEGERHIEPVTLGAGELRTFSLVVANSWSENSELIGPLFSAPGRYLIRFTYPVAYQSGGTEAFVELTSAEHELELRPLPNVSAASTATHLAWTLEPHAGVAVASEAELASWEKELRASLSSRQDSPLSNVQRYALAMILFDRSMRPNVTSPALLRDEAARLATAAARNGFAYQREALRLDQKIQAVAAQGPR